MRELEFESGYAGEIEKEAQVVKERHREPRTRSISFMTQGMII
jgi:hypothetical protein